MRPTNSIVPSRLTIHQLRQILPQEFPFLMLDHVIDYKKNEYLTAVKNVTANEWCFQGFEADAGLVRLPEVLILEAAAQAAIVLYHVSRNKEGDPLPRYMLGKAQAEFFRPVVVGDQLKIHSLGTKILPAVGYWDTDISVADEKIATVKVLCSVRRECKPHPSHG